MPCPRDSFAFARSVTDAQVAEGHQVQERFRTRFNALLGSVNQTLWCVEKYDPRAVVSGYHPEVRWGTVIEGAILGRPVLTVVDPAAIGHLSQPRFELGVGKVQGGVRVAGGRAHGAAEPAADGRSTRAGPVGRSEVASRPLCVRRGRKRREYPEPTGQEVDNAEGIEGNGFRA